VDLKPNFAVISHPYIRSQDLPNLCKELQDKYQNLYTKILSIDPYTCRLEVSSDKYIQFASHDLERELTGYRAMEVIYRIEGYEEHYRIVYKIINTDKNKKIEIVSFGLHDYAYSIARHRIRQN
jgi:hypothetical protein